MLNVAAVNPSGKQQFNVEFFEHYIFSSNPFSAAVHEQGHMDMEMIKLTSLACIMSTTHQMNGVFENSLSPAGQKRAF